MNFTVTIKVITLNNYNLIAYSILKNTLLIKRISISTCCMRKHSSTNTAITITIILYNDN